MAALPDASPLREGPLHASAPARALFLTTDPMTLWIFLRDQMTDLAATGVAVHACAAPGPLLDRLGRETPVTIHAAPLRRALTPWTDLKALHALDRILRAVKPDLLHASTPKAALLGMLAGRRRGVATRVFFARGLLSCDATGWRRRLYHTCERCTARLATHVYFNSPSQWEYASAAGIVAPAANPVAGASAGSTAGRMVGAGMSRGVSVADLDAALAALPDGLPPALRALHGERQMDPALRVVGYVGRLSPDKGVAELLGAWRRLRARRPETRLLLVGPWEMPGAEDARAVLDADERVARVDYLDPVHPAYGVLDLLLFPSYREGFPNVPMEAAAAGIPAVAARAIGTVDAVLDGTTGILVPPRDAAALAEAAEIYLADEARRRRDGVAARRRVLTDFDASVLRPRFVAEWRAMATTGAPPPDSHS